MSNQSLDREFDVRFARHEDELKWLYMELYHNDRRAWEYFTGMIVPMVDWIAPVTIMPGENEMQSLAEGVLRVLRGEEKARFYPDKE